MQNHYTEYKMKRYELSDYFLSLTTAEQIVLLTDAGFKEGFWRESKKSDHYWMTYHFCFFNSKIERISYEFSFDVAIDLDDLKSWNDFDNLEAIFWPFVTFALKSLMMILVSRTMLFLKLKIVDIVFLFLI